MVNWKYDLFLYMMGNLVDLFFREVVPRGSWKVPQSGPVLFVAAPHANQVSIASLFSSRTNQPVRRDWQAAGYALELKTKKKKTDSRLLAIL